MNRTSHIGEKINRLRQSRERARLGGGKEKVDRQHAKGRLTAQERIDHLLDPGSFVELNMLVGHAIEAPGDGIIAGHGTIDGKRVCIYAQDATVLGGSVGALHGNKMYKTVERALDMGVPFIGLHDSPGGRVLRMDHPGAHDATTESNEKGGHSVYFPVVQASGIIPQVSAILGSCAGSSVYCAALTDFIFMVDVTSQMFITGPRIVKETIGEEVSMEELGSARVHSQISGVCDVRTDSEEECFQKIRKLLSYLPSNSSEAPPTVPSSSMPRTKRNALAGIIPPNPHEPYDVHRIIALLLDGGDFFEIKAEFASEIVVGLGRLAGQTVGIVANQPMVRAGSLTVNSSRKQARFIRFCDCFNIPLILLVDTPAYFPGKDQEWAGIITHGAKVVYALCEAVVPRVAVILRKVYGGGTLGMGISPGLGTDFVFAWPTAEMGVMGAKQSVELFYREDIKGAENPAAFKEEKIREYQEQYSDPLAVASKGTQITDVIEPSETRGELIRALELLRTKKVLRHPKRHGNIPL